jgi:hypothetical protein
MDPSIPTPPEYENMPIQPLVDKKIDDMILGCIDFYPDDAKLCLVHERDRVDMSLRQPQSMCAITPALGLPRSAHNGKVHKPPVSFPRMKRSYIQRTPHMSSHYVTGRNDTL